MIIYKKKIFHASPRNWMWCREVDPFFASIILQFSLSFWELSWIGYNNVAFNLNYDSHLIRKPKFCSWRITIWTSELPKLQSHVLVEQICILASEFHFKPYSVVCHLLLLAYKWISVVELMKRKIVSCNWLYSMCMHYYINWRSDLCHFTGRILDYGARVCDEQI